MSLKDKFIITALKATPLSFREAWAEKQITRIKDAKVLEYSSDNGIHDVGLPPENTFGQGKKLLEQQIMPDLLTRKIMENSGWKFREISTSISIDSPYRTGKETIQTPSGPWANKDDALYHDAIKSALCDTHDYS